MTTNEAILEEVVRVVREHLPKEDSGKNCLIGYEGEYPVVNGVLHPASAKPILDCLDENNIRKDVGYEFGECLLEIGVSPSKSIFELKNRVDAKMRLLAEIADPSGLHLLGYGGHPMGRPTLDEWRIRTPRYDMLEKALPPGIEWFLRVASEQTHVALPEKELIQGLNSLNALAPLLRVVCANSGYLGGQASLSQIGRDQAYDQLPDDRVGCQGPFDSLEGYFDWLLKRHIYFYLDESGEIVNCSKEQLTGYKAISQKGRKMEQWEEIFSSFVKPLMTTVWPEARMSQHFTLEARFACAPPPFDTLASTALVIGLLRNTNRAEEFVKHLVEENAWNPSQRRREIARNPDKFFSQAQELVTLAQKGLKEEELSIFQPIVERVSRNAFHLPASYAQRLLEARQVEQFLDSFSFRKY